MGYDWLYFSSGLRSSALVLLLSFVIVSCFNYLYKKAFMLAKVRHKITKFNKTELIKSVFQLLIKFLIISETEIKICKLCLLKFV